MCPSLQPFKQNFKKLSYKLEDDRTVVVHGGDGVETQVAVLVGGEYTSARQCWNTFPAFAHYCAPSETFAVAL